MQLITLTTDFGLKDPYVACMKGVILGINPRATIIDISHEISPQSIAQASFVFAGAYPYFPHGTIHVVVLDPGVGSARKAVIVKTPEALLVAPDNGVLTYALLPYLAGDQAGSKIRLSPPLEAAYIEEPRFWRQPVSRTFHGRDIFAPVAAHLSAGVPMTEFGPAASMINLLSLPQPHPGPEGSLDGEIVHMDRFGNLITNIPGSALVAGRVRISIAGREITDSAGTYEEGPRDRPFALVGSSGYVELALAGGSAAFFLQAGPGTRVALFAE